MVSRLALITDWGALAPYIILTLAGSYLIGSIPFGLILARLSGAGDIRKIGSGNIGATNVLRTGKRWAALATLILDAAKGTVPVLIARQEGGDLFAAFAGLGAFMGHIFPVWLRFKGGKGVATFIGISLGLVWQVGLLICVSWLTVAWVFRISSLSALVAVIAAPIYFALWGDSLFAVLMAVLAAFAVIAHRANIRRLLRNQEPRIGRP